MNEKVMNDIDSMISTVNQMIKETQMSHKNSRQEILADVKADCQASWIENIQAAARAIEHLRDISHRSSPDTAEIGSFLNSVVLRITSAISDVKSYESIQNTIRNLD